MDTTSLGLAYAELLAAVDSRTTDGVTTPPPGEWDAGQLLAHLVSVDAGVLAVACTVAAGGLATFDNRLSLDEWNLSRISGRAGGPAQLRARINVQGEALCALAEQLSDDELDVAVPTLFLSGGTLQLDQPIRLRDLIAGIADDHLPRHTQQLLALRGEGER